MIKSLTTLITVVPHETKIAHGTLNYDRLTGDVSEVIDGISTPLSTQSPSGPTVPPEHFSLPTHPTNA